MEMEDAHFSDQLTLEQGAIIFFNEGKLNNGHDYYLYIAVRGTEVQKYFSLVNAPKAPSMAELEEIGTVLAFGEGQPSSEIKCYLKERYGVYHPCN